MGQPMEERLEKLTDQLQKGIMELYASGRYGEYLAAMSKFHHYSFGNAMLILLQCPNATRVAGYNTWRKEFGRNVKRHEKGISILAPCPSRKYVWQEVTDPKTGAVQYNKDGSPKMETQIITVTRFKVATVFDVSQTEGRELPSIGVTRLTGEVEITSNSTMPLFPCPPFRFMLSLFPEKPTAISATQNGGSSYAPGSARYRLSKPLSTKSPMPSSMPRWMGKRQKAGTKRKWRRKALLM